MCAKQITNDKVVLGKMIKVENQNKRHFENDYYVAVQVEDQDGQNERCLLFTQIELSDISKINSNFLMEKMVTGRIYNFSIGRSNLFLVKLKNYQDGEIIIRLTKTKLANAQKRAKNNPQDLTKKSWLVDLAD